MRPYRLQDHNALVPKKHRRISSFSLWSGNATNKSTTIKKSPTRRLFTFISIIPYVQKKNLKKIIWENKDLAMVEIAHNLTKEK